MALCGFLPPVAGSGPPAGRGYPRGRGGFKCEADHSGTPFPPLSLEEKERPTFGEVSP